MAKYERFDPRQHPRDRNGRFIRKRSPLPVGGKKGVRSYGVGRGRWPVQATLDVGPGSGRPGATVGARIRYRDSKRDVAVGVIADGDAARRAMGRAADRVRRAGTRQTRTNNRKAGSRNG